MRPRRSEEEILADLLSLSVDDFIARSKARIAMRRAALAAAGMARLRARCPGLALERVPATARAVLGEPRLAPRVTAPFVLGHDPWGKIARSRRVPPVLEALGARLGWLETPVDALAEVASDDEDAEDLLHGLAATELA